MHICWKIILPLRKNVHQVHGCWMWPTNFKHLYHRYSYTWTVHSTHLIRWKYSNTSIMGLYALPPMVTDLALFHVDTLALIMVLRGHMGSECMVTMWLEWSLDVWENEPRTVKELLPFVIAVSVCRHRWRKSHVMATWDTVRGCWWDT